MNNHIHICVFRASRAIPWWWKKTFQNFSKKKETLLPGPQPTADWASAQLTIPFLIAGFLDVWRTFQKTYCSVSVNESCAQHVIWYQCSGWQQMTIQVGDRSKMYKFRSYSIYQSPWTAKRPWPTSSDSILHRVLLCTPVSELVPSTTGRCCVLGGVGGLVSPLFRPDSHPSQFGTSPLHAAGRVKLEFEMSPINGVRRSTPILRRACSTKIVGIRYASSVSILTEVTITNLNLILNQINLTGIFPPIVTPFNPDESIAWDKLRGNLARWPLRAFSDRMMKSLLIQMEAGAAERLPGPRQQRGVCLSHPKGEGGRDQGGQGGGGVLLVDVVSGVLITSTIFPGWRRSTCAGRLRMRVNSWDNWDDECHGRWNWSE